MRIKDIGRIHRNIRNNFSNRLQSDYVFENDLKDEKDAVGSNSFIKGKKLLGKYGTIYISDHAMTRMKERCGWNRKASIRMMQKILLLGKNSKEIVGRRKLWLKERALDEHDSCIVYGDMAYIFRKNVLVTAMHTPSLSHDYFGMNKEAVYA